MNDYLGAGHSDTSPKRQRRDDPGAGASGLCQSHPRGVYLGKKEAPITKVTHPFSSIHFVA